MRGIRRSRLVSEVAIRISPAHAGNTLGQFLPDLDDGDQPRTCGEYTHSMMSTASWLGSAPHMRGIPPTGGQ